LAAFNEALDQNAGNVDALISRGLLFYTLGDLPKALTDFDAALQVNPRHSRARYQRALAHLALGQNDEARVDLESLSKNLPEQADLRREVMARISSLNNLNNPTALFESPFRTGQIDRAELGDLPAEEPAAPPAEAAPIDPTLVAGVPPLAEPDATVAYSGGLTGPLPGADQPDADATIAYSGGLTGPLPGAEPAPDDPGATIMPPSAKGGA
ncbi:MAG TPA: tetratricopeptide repeat protein, partial [Herpetosiphonaceae bacterium]